MKTFKIKSKDLCDCGSDSFAKCDDVVVCNKCYQQYDLKGWTRKWNSETGEYYSWFFEIK